MNLQSRKALTPIIIPPKKPDSASNHSSEKDKFRIFLGTIYLFLDEYDIKPNDYIFTIKVTENPDHSLVDTATIPIHIYDIQKLGDLTLDSAEIVYPINQYTMQGYYIKNNIFNSQIHDINESAKIKYYYFKNGNYFLLGTTLIKPLEGNEETNAMLFIDSNTYNMISSNQIINRLVN